MKKITFLLLHLGYGGVETSTINTCNSLCDDYDIELIVFYNLKKNQLSLLNPKIKVKFLYDGEPNRDEFMNDLKKFKIFSLIKEGIKGIKILYLKKHLMIKEIKNSDSKYIISTRIDYSILLNKYGSKDAVKIVQEHCHHNGVKKYINKIKSLKNINYLFALTKSLKNDYVKFLKGSNVNIKIVPNMVSIPEEKSNLKSKNLITISRLHPGKKIDEMIEIFSLIQNKTNKLYIVGSGSEDDLLKETAKKYNVSDRVIFTGYKSKEEMIPYIMDSSVFLMTSISEGLPMVLLEAMGYGLPCIAYNTESGVSDIIDNDVDGYIINNRNQTKYIDTINKVLSDNKELKRLSKNTADKVKKFSRDEVKKIWLKILK